MGYEGHVVGLPDRADRVRGTAEAMDLLAIARDAVGGEVVSAGGTGTYALNTLATEIQAGSYALMDTAYASEADLPFRPTVSIVATVISVNAREGFAVADCGLKALGMDHGGPDVLGHVVWFCSDEHVTFSPANGAALPVVGEPRRRPARPCRPHGRLPRHAAHRRRSRARRHGRRRVARRPARLVNRPATVRRMPADGLGNDLGALDATAQAELVRAGDLTALELVDAAITRIEKMNPELNAVIHPLFDRARATAAHAPTGDAPFSGVPIVLKDLDGSSAGDPLHLGNAALRDAGHVADHDCHLVAKLRAAGCIPVGKTNASELGLLPTAEPKAYGPTRNPWNTEHSPGGSSGGSAAAVACGMVPVGHAGDGGGSIRIPASACGLFGLKPSRGRVSMGPDVGEAWGGFVVRHVVTRSVRDSAGILDAIAGAMPGDPYTAAPPARPYVDEVGSDPGRLRIGLRTSAPADLAVTDDECVAAAEDAARLLESLGHHVEVAAPAAFDDLELLAAFATVMTVSVVADLEEIGRMLGREVTSADVERLTWAQYEQGRATPAIAYLARGEQRPRVDSPDGGVVGTAGARGSGLRSAPHTHDGGAARTPGRDRPRRR